MPIGRLLVGTVFNTCITGRSGKVVETDGRQGVRVEWEEGIPRTKLIHPEVVVEATQP